MHREIRLHRIQECTAQLPAAARHPPLGKPGFHCRIVSHFPGAFRPFVFHHRALHSSCHRSVSNRARRVDRSNFQAKSRTGRPRRSSFGEMSASVVFAPMPPLPSVNETSPSRPAMLPCSRSALSEALHCGVLGRRVGMLPNPLRIRVDAEAHRRPHTAPQRL